MLKLFLKGFLVGYPIHLLISYLFDGELQWFKSLIIMGPLALFLAYINHSTIKK